MHGINLFLMTCMEIVAFIIVWGAISNNINYRNFYKLILIVIITSILTLVFDYMNLNYSGVILYVVVYFMIYIFFKESIKLSLVIYLFSLVMCLMLQLAIVFTLYKLSFITNDVLNFSNAMKVNSFFILISILFRLILPLNKFKSLIEKGIDQIVFAFINIVLYTFVLKTAWDYDNKFVWKHTILMLAISISLLLMDIIFIKTIIEKNHQEKVNQIQIRDNAIICNLIDDVRRKQHEYKNHMNTIYGIIQVESQDKVKQSVKSYIQTSNSELKDLDVLINLNNKILCGIIYSKHCFAKENDINFKFYIEAETFISSINDFQLSEVLNNIIDNAFEMVKHEDSNDVILTIGNEKCHNFIELKNKGNPIKPCDRAKIFEKGYTTKKSIGHGYGLYNVKKIIDSVNGEIQLYYDEGFTVFKIIL